MTYAFGGSKEYHGKDMWTAHESLVRQKGLNDHHFDVIVKHLVGALQHFNVPDVGSNVSSALLAFCVTGCLPFIAFLLWMSSSCMHW